MHTSCWFSFLKASSRRRNSRLSKPRRQQRGGKTTPQIIKICMTNSDGRSFMFPFLTQPCSHVLSVSLSGNVSDGKHVQWFVKFSPQIRISFLNSRLPLLSRPDYLKSLMRASTSSSESNSTFFISNSWLMKPRSKASTEFLLHLNFFHEIDNLPKKQNNKRS